jgi:hypothetical protein
VSKSGLFEPFIYKNEHFTKTGSGQTWGKLHKKTVFPQGVTQSMGACENVFFIGPFLDFKNPEYLPRQAPEKHR